MKKLLYFLSFISLSLFTNSCTDDPVDPVVGDNAPVLIFTLNPGTGFIDGDKTVEAGSTIKLKLDGTDSDKDLTSLHIESKNGSDTAIHVPSSVILVNGAPANGNPISIPSADGENLRYSIEFPTADKADTITYTFTLEDSKGYTDIVSFTIITTGTKAFELTGKKLSNSAGPPGMGGIDLHTGKEVGSDSIVAELSDLGVINKVTDGTWKQQFKATNSETIIVKPLAGFDYNSVFNRDAIVAAYNAGTNISNPNIVGNKDDVYLVKRGSDYWAVKITKVVVTPPLGMGGDNLDYFELSIKR